MFENEQLGRVVDDSLGEKKTGHQFKVMPRGPHGHGQAHLFAILLRTIPDSDLQGLFGHHQIVAFFALVMAVPDD